MVSFILQVILVKQMPLKQAFGEDTKRKLMDENCLMTTVRLEVGCWKLEVRASGSTKMKIASQTIREL